MRVAVIGGGPSGLVTLKYLITAHKSLQSEPIEARLFESKESIAGTFRYRVYEDSELVSSKYLTAFSDFRCLEEDADFLSTSAYCTYLEGYATCFDLWSHINLSTKVRTVRRREGDGHVVTYSHNGVDQEWECDAVAICSGLHVDPHIPVIKGIEHVPMVIHSSEFKSRQDFGEGKSVMVLGAGETAMDITYLAVTSPTTAVTMCHRDGFLFAPKVVPRPIIKGHLYASEAEQRNIPTDTTVWSLFDTAYVHPVLQKSSLLWAYYDLFVKWMFAYISGTSAGCDQWVGGISKERHHISSVFLCKTGKAVPYISAPYRNPTPFNARRAKYINVPVPDTKNRTIDLAPWPTQIKPSGFVEFSPSSRPEAARMRDIPVKPDIVVFATGYSQNFPFLDSSYGTPQHADRRGIWNSNDESVAFIGFVRPALGAIPPLSELQAQLWVATLLNAIPQANYPPRDIDYKLRVIPGRREYEGYGVDHESYAYQLALDMGSAASFTDVCRFGWKVLLTWALGSNFNTKFRLVGPWRWSGAEGVMKGELWDIVQKSGGWFYITFYSIIPFVIFGVLSALFWVVFLPLDIVTGTVSRVSRILHSGKSKSRFKNGKIVAASKLS